MVAAGRMSAKNSRERGPRLPIVGMSEVHAVRTTSLRLRRPGQSLLGDGEDPPRLPGCVFAFCAYGPGSATWTELPTRTAREKR